MRRSKSMFFSALVGLAVVTISASPFVAKEVKGETLYGNMGTVTQDMMNRDSSMSSVVFFIIVFL